MTKQEIQDVRAIVSGGGAERPVLSLEQRREMMDATSDMFPPRADCSCEDVNAGGCHALWQVAAGARTDRAVLYLHGGGYVVGSSKSHMHLTAELSAQTAAAVLSLDYRLAPEHPYPAGLEDAVAAYKWLVDEKGISPSSIMLAGDSAGGGLAIATLLMLRDREMGEPGGAMVISPWVDLTGDARSMQTRAALDPMVQRQGLLESAAQYLNGKDAASHLASPAFARMDGLPPLLIQVGTDETLYDDALRLAGNAAAAKVDVTLEIWPDMIHVWHYFFPMLSEGREALAKMGAFYQAKIGG